MILVEHTGHKNENYAVNEVGKLSDACCLGCKQVNEILDKADGNTADGAECVRGDECRQV